MATPLLEVTGLMKSYGRQEALRGVDFTVDEGELFGLLGPNGAGKSTLISILSCLLAPSAGRATLAGDAIRVDHKEIRRRIGLVPQDLAIYGELSARENLTFFGRLYGLHGSDLTHRANEVLEAIALTDRADDRADTFSGGMKRRLNLGVAIMHRPQLLFLDEPTTGVDPQSRNRIFDEVRRLNAAGVTIVYTSHYMEEVQALCTRVGILDHGRLIAVDTVPGLLRRMKGQIRVRFAEVSETLLSQLATSPDAERLGDREFVWASADVPSTLFRLTALFAEMQIEPDRIEASEPTLEQVFLSLTGRALRD